MHHHRNHGFGLIETIIVLVAGSLLIAGALTFYQSVSASFQAHKASQQALTLTNSIMRAWVSAPSFVGISNSRVVSENLLPPGMELNGPRIEPVITTAFGGRVLIDPTTIEGQPGRGMMLTFTDVPKRGCGQFVINASSYGFRAITINSQDVLDANGQLQEHVLASECAARPDSTVVFIVDRDFTSVGAPAPQSCVLPSPATQVETDTCPAGYVGSITMSRTAFCHSSVGLATWGPWSVSRSCAPACRRVIHSPQRRTTTPCPPGQLGAIEEQRVSECPSTIGSPLWSDWAVVSNTCAPLCAAPADELDMSPPCPAGQSGLIVHRRTASCPERTGDWHWNEWEEITNTCQ